MAITKLFGSFCVYILGSNGYFCLFGEAKPVLVQKSMALEHLKSLKLGSAMG